MPDGTMIPLQDRIDDIKRKYEPLLEALRRKGRQIEEDYKKPSTAGAVLGVDFHVEWKDVEMIFDVPSITMRRQEIALDLPEIRAERQHIAFDVPDVRMVDRKVGQYPEFHGLTVVWKDIIITVPEPYMRRVDIYFDLPSVTMKRQDFSLDLPQVTMERVRWVVGLPQFTVINVSVQTDAIKESGEALRQEGEALAARMKGEIEAEVARFKAAAIATAYGAKSNVENSYNSALGTLKSAMDDLQRQGCDPIKVPTPNGEVNLRKAYDDLDAARLRALGEVAQVANV